MKKAYLIITVATIVVAAVLLFTSPMRETFQTNNEMYKRDNPCEYQLVIEDDSIIISDYGRRVAIVSLDSAGNVGKELIKDNE